MSSSTMRRSGLSCALWAALIIPPTISFAQTPAPPPTDDEDPINVGDTNVGYIDGAIPGNQFRLRFDAAHNNERPTRAEFFYARGAPVGPGLPEPETGVDYQDISAYLECALDRCSSVFVEFPVRFINPDNNENSGGLGDMNLGFKRALIYSCDLVASFQFKTYIPTGDPSRGLSNDHVSLEPGFLLYRQLDERWALEGELRYWIPIAGTDDFDGDVIRYGVGLSYDACDFASMHVRPVVEVVGWTVLDGQVAVTEPPAPTRIEDASGDTIVNLKVGVRLGVGCNSEIYAGYGQALTGDRWYDNIVRLEFRMFF